MHKRFHHIYGIAIICMMVAMFVFSACSPSHKGEVDELNYLSYALHYRNLDSTKVLAEKALTLSEDYPAGYAEACNNLAFVVPIIALGQVIFTFGISIIFSTLNLFFRDLERFVSLGIMLMFYCTPILYASDMIPEKFSWIITYNPLASMILSWRQLFMDGVLNYEYISILYITGLVLTIVGLSIFNKLKYRFAEIL